MKVDTRFNVGDKVLVVGGDECFGRVLEVFEVFFTCREKGGAKTVKYKLQNPGAGTVTVKEEFLLGDPDEIEAYFAAQAALAIEAIAAI